MHGNVGQNLIIRQQSQRQPLFHTFALSLDQVSTRLHQSINPTLFTPALLDSFCYAKPRQLLSCHTFECGSFFGGASSCYYWIQQQSIFNSSMQHSSSRLDSSIPAEAESIACSVTLHCRKVMSLTLSHPHTAKHLDCLDLLLFFIRQCCKRSIQTTSSVADSRSERKFTHSCSIPGMDQILPIRKKEPEKVALVQQMDVKVCERFRCIKISLQFLFTV